MNFFIIAFPFRAFCSGPPPSKISREPATGKGRARTGTAVEGISAKIRLRRERDPRYRRLRVSQPQPSVSWIAAWSTETLSPERCRRPDALSRSRPLQASMVRNGRYGRREEHPERVPPLGSALKADKSQTLGMEPARYPAPSNPLTFARLYVPKPKSINSQLRWKTSITSNP